ncbi:hypothetical protein MLD38_009991 [Melastoma candidum]|uniref:Uncharacterized protein n=1 Tax=Melastoma candidum TaxID=119954 RepID=A0ACB9QYG0_9MYRT|nr:hypothetical protein MLD38_009991 [Melastoma candidum]
MAKIMGFYKGFKFMSQIFVVKEDEDEEEEMEIGLPTDVKHVAHIGGDDPLGSGPAWMKEFTGAPEFQSSLRETADQTSTPGGTTEDGKSNLSKSTDNVTGDEAPHMPKKHRRKKIKSTTSSKSTRSSRPGKSKLKQPEMKSIAIAAES